MFTVDVYLLIFLFITPQNLRAASADRSDTLPCDRYLVAIYNAGPKIRGSPLKNLGQKHAKFGAN